MNHRFLCGTAATLLLAIAVFAQQPAEPDTPKPDVELKPVPQILRLHLPILGQHRGVLIASVQPGSVPEKAGLRGGDVLLEAGGKAVIAGDPLAQLDASFPMVVIRRGRTRVLHPGFFDGAADSLMPPAMMFNPSVPGSVSSAVSSVSGAGGRSVSVSRAGEQIALEMSIPDLAEGPIRFRGTSQEIRRQLDSSSLSEPAKREVRQALQQTR